jgi:hypothetical protein
LLTDEAANEIGLDPDGDHTPNDAFALLGKYTARKPGDILETVRTNPGDRWLLCNGDLVREGQYPKLREVMPYNTDWRRVAPFQNFDRVQAIYGKPGQWALIDSWTTGGAGKNGKVAALYDAKTDTITEISCPVAGNNYGIIGLSHDGDRYILGVGRRNLENENPNSFLLYTSTDLTNWTKAHEYTITGYHEPYDMIYDGTGTLVAAEYYSYTSNPESKYSVYVYYTDKAMTKTTTVSGQWTTEYLNNFAIVHGGWFFTRYNSEYVSARASGSSGNLLFSFSRNGKVAFFSDRYWIGTPSKGKSVSYIEVYNTETKKSSNIYVADLFVDISISAGVYYDGCEYNKNTNEWELYLHWYSSSGISSYSYYIAYISADADPSDVTKYRLVRVGTLPDTMGNEQMASDRSRLTADGMLRDPNQKYLPKHSGDTLKYIYTG